MFKASFASCLENDGQALTDADADRCEAVATALALQVVGERTENADARASERVTDRDRAAVGVEDLGIEIGPVGHARERLRRERLIELDRLEVAPADAGSAQR